MTEGFSTGKVGFYYFDAEHAQTYLITVEVTELHFLRIAHALGKSSIPHTDDLAVFDK